LGVAADLNTGNPGSEIGVNTKKGENPSRSGKYLAWPTKLTASSCPPDEQRF